MNTRKTLAGIGAICFAFVLAVFLPGDSDRAAADCYELTGCFTLTTECASCSSSVTGCGWRVVGYNFQSFLAESDEGMEDWNGSGAGECYGFYSCLRTTFECPYNPNEKTCTSAANPIQIWYTFDDWVGTSPC